MTAKASPAPAPVGVGFRSARGRVLASLMLTTGLVALDSTIIATAVPSVVRDLGGFSQFPWLFSIYLVTQAVTVPLYGKLADTVGRKPVMFFGIAVFLAGSVLCGVAWSMPALIAFRAVQGVGAGALQPIAMTVVGDLYSVQERARVQGYLASVWGISAVLGPTLGGVFSQYLSWRWIFFVNLPLGAAAAAMLARHFHEQVTRRHHKIDYAGAGLLVVGCTLVILGLLEGGVAWGWASVPSLVICTVGPVLLVGFVLVEQRTAEPILPLWVFRRRILVGGNLVAACVGALLIGLSSYIPTFVQAVLGTGPVVAGFALAALTMGWPLAAAVSGRIYLRIGFRDTALLGASIIIAGTLLGAGLGRDTQVWQVAGVCFLIGVGMGFMSSPTVVAIQSVVGWDRRGVVTGTNMFSRSIGSAVGVAIFGAVANATMAHRLAHAPAALAGHVPQNVDAASRVLAETGAARHSAAAEFVQTALYQAVHHVLVGLVMVAVLALAALLLIPRKTEPLSFE